jgi:aspartate/methionine/tyrosine aminotransferase
MARTNYAQLSTAQHTAQLARIINPDQRAAYFKAFVNPQVVNLGTAENFLLLPFLQQNAFSNLPTLGLNTARYPIIAPGQPFNGGLPYYGDSTNGNATLLDGVASFLSTQWNVEVSSSNMYGSSGVISALEVIALALFSPGDQVLIPAPMFYGFTWSFSQKTVAMQFIPFEIDNEVNLTAADVAKALQQYPNAKLLVLTNPNNPLGLNYPKSLLEEIYALFLANPDRHIISDEIYACSQVGDSSAFVSALALNAYQKFPDQIHVTWGMSKDFGLAGFRAGFFISNNQAVQEALDGGQCGPIPSWYASEAWFAPLVTLQPYVLQKLFFDANGAPDPALANQAMVVYKGLLQQQYKLTAQLLDQGNIPYYKQNQGALFFWIDLSKYLSLVPKTVSDQPPLCASLYKYDSVEERRLYNYILAAGLQLVRGQECFNVKPGFFRLCYTAASAADVTTGINNMIAALKKLG